MTEGNLAKWLKKEGDEVKSGDVIAEIETDKATMEVEAVDEGTLGKIIVQEGTQGVAVNQVIALLLEEGEDARRWTAAARSPLPSRPTAGGRTPAAAPAAERRHPRATAPSSPRPTATASSRARSPSAWREQSGLDLRQTRAAAPMAASSSTMSKPPFRRHRERARPRRRRREDRGREARTSQAAGQAAAQSPPPPPSAQKPAGVDAKDFSTKLGIKFREIPNSGMRKVIARRLTEAKQTVPHFYLTIDLQIDQLLKTRAEQ